MHMTWFMLKTDGFGIGINRDYLASHGSQLAENQPIPVSGQSKGASLVCVCLYVSSVFVYLQE